MALMAPIRAQVVQGGNLPALIAAAAERYGPGGTKLLIRDPATAEVALAIVLVANLYLSIQTSIASLVQMAEKVDQALFQRNHFSLA